MRFAPFTLVAGLAAVPATAAMVNLTIPRIPTAEYAKPYVALYLEPAAGGPARTVAIWYALNKRDGENGTKWLTELRAWWRKGGRNLRMPADGVSGATRAPGSYTVPLPADALTGKYVLTVEAAREHGGREVVTLPVRVGAAASGKTELGAVAIR